MILVDTSVWVDHLHKSDAVLSRLLEDGLVLVHPFVIGELALGNLRESKRILDAIQALPKAIVATDAEVLRFIDLSALAGRGIGYVDAHLLASLRLTEGAKIWTRDRRLNEAAGQLRLAASPVQ